jgi:hypothetical protein
VVVTHTVTTALRVLHSIDRTDGSRLRLGIYSSHINQTKLFESEMWGLCRCGDENVAPPNARRKSFTIDSEEVFARCNVDSIEFDFY